MSDFRELLIGQVGQEKPQVSENTFQVLGILALVGRRWSILHEFTLDTSLREQPENQHLVLHGVDDINPERSPGQIPFSTLAAKPCGLADDQDIQKFV